MENKTTQHTLGDERVVILGTRNWWLYNTSGRVGHCFDRECATEGQKLL
jgi:hypothetical protein